MARLLPPPSRATAAVALSLAASVAAGAAPASAETRFSVRGQGWGHGVGMSQYGAFGFAKNGAGYRDILTHYYTGTQVSPLGAKRQVRVLLQGPKGLVKFTGATRAGTRKLSASRTYAIRRGPALGTLDLLSATGKRVKRFASPLAVKGTNPVVLKGGAGNGVTDGAYRGVLEFRAGSYLGVTAVNVLGLEDYIRGVVSRESPAGWPIEALKAQAVAARSYAVTTSKAGDGFDQYADTRSQVYGGVDAERPTTDQAVRETRGEVVTYQGTPVTTFFFSTSGGRTEDVENTSLGREPKPWLKSVEDPYDDASPRHKWGPVRMSFKAAAKKLGSLVKGEFRGIDVVKRGRSPRIVAADVVGSGGRVRTDGATLRARLGLFDTWAYFTSIDSEEEPAEGGGEQPPRTDSAGGVPPGAMASRAVAAAIAGDVFPVRPGAFVEIERRTGRRTWTRVGVSEIRSSGRYSFRAPGAGSYRVKYRRTAGPTVRIR